MSNINDIIALIDSGDLKGRRKTAYVNYETAERKLDEFLLNLGTTREDILNNENHDLYPLVYSINQRIKEGYKRFQ